MRTRRHSGAAAAAGAMCRAAMVALLAAVSAPARAAEFADVVALVEQKGWTVDLGAICGALDLPVARRCTFQQVSVQDTEGRADPRAFNVPEHESAEAPYVLLFHLTPLFGEFFVVSARGELLKAFYRAAGRGYDVRPLDDVRPEFERDLAFWRDNFERIRGGLR